jgi:glutathione S-transferase
MATLHHYPFCPHSRFVRLVAGEIGLEPDLVEERPWERRTEFLVLNPAGAVPVLIDGETPTAMLVVPGAGLMAEYLDETKGPGLNGARLMPQETPERIEVRRLMDWFNGKFYEEVTSHLVTEKIYKRFMKAEQGGGGPDMAAIRAARNNIRYHLHYIGFLLARRNCLAGSKLTYADLAAAAQLSCADYLGDVPWEENEAAKAWYARVKSRPSFRSLLADRVPGMPPAAHYENLDF